MFMFFQGGLTHYGREIGILMLDTIFPRIPGDIGLECTNMASFSAPIQAIAGVPVFGINNLIELIHYTVRPPRF
jgi:hypothetical protein